MNSLKLTNFDDIKVSTKTYTASTNILLDIHRLYDMIDVVPYTVHPKKRGRKRKDEIPHVPQVVPYGSIINVNCEGKSKGVVLKPKSKKQREKASWFRNAITIVMILDKPINFKVCRNGTFQMTGCTKDEHPEMCVKKIWDIVGSDPETFSFTRPTNSGAENVFESMIIPSMRNIDFDLGFNVDRSKLSRYLHRDDTELHCLLETSFGYTGVNIKIPITKPRDGMKITKMLHVGVEWQLIETTYLEYLGILDEKVRMKKNKEQRYNTFLVFHSGKVIFSGLTYEFMKDTYYSFMTIIKNAREDIEEKLEK
jgi:hypothetical protein